MTLHAGTLRKSTEADRFVIKSAQKEVAFTAVTEVWLVRQES